MSFSGVVPLACLQRVRTLAVRAWKLAMLGVICSLASLLDCCVLGRILTWSQDPQVIWPPPKGNDSIRTI